MKVFLDDERVTPDGWTRVHWPHEAIRLLELGTVEEISLDQDLGDDERGTGYDVILWVEEAVALRVSSPKSSYTLRTVRRGRKWNQAYSPSNALYSNKTDNNYCYGPPRFVV
ncbi:cyclic-phosphate processing receiver domain-containing protein [Caballeronia novacaledonica]|uniref:Cyclic-phosphate processing Receiver domain-containing protein n=1 Tax=Caballeronia novacaledonica TaxID=1544861 RepID=A0AA37IGC5_9BURK|nr:cyclic-phosphate processing receiver domain-containing protein [Caballeronia novacaledonica]GJH29245.1 hypothetical protein CBA19CS42_32035 [Caballeronia novacaledonica]